MMEPTFVKTSHCKLYEEMVQQARTAAGGGTTVTGRNVPE